MNPTRPPLTLLIAAPRGFCAGVDRAIRIVELALERYGAPVYVRHEIVHNKFVVESLKAKGAVFVPELDAVPDGVPVVFSAHGVPKAVPLSHANLLHAGAVVSKHQSLGPSDRVLSSLPLYHINGQCIATIATLVSGGSLVMPARFSTSQWWSLVERYRPRYA